MPKIIAVTGASGFVGRALCLSLISQGFKVRALVRSEQSICEKDFEGLLQVIVVGELGAMTDWSAAFVDCDCVVHCAARAHVLDEKSIDSIALYREINVNGSRRLAEQAATMGVRRVIFVSSIGIYGINTNLRPPFSLADAASPVEDYALSKWEAELALHEVAAHGAIDVVVVRAPLVYGHGVKGNFSRLVDLIKSGIPLPLGALKNERSLVNIRNLVDLLICCINHPLASGKTFLVSDKHDVSTPELLHKIAGAMNKSARLFYVPVWMLKIAGRLTGRTKEIERLVGSLQIDIGYTCNLLGWTPKFSIDQGINEMVHNDCN